MTAPGANHSTRIPPPANRRAPGLPQLGSPPELSSRTLEFRASRAGVPGSPVRVCVRVRVRGVGVGTPREGDGKFGRKNAIRQGSHSPTSPGAQSLLPAGRLGLNLCVRASIPGTNRRRRRSSPPSAAAYFEGANQSLGAWSGAPPPGLPVVALVAEGLRLVRSIPQSACMVGVPITLDSV